MSNAQIQRMQENLRHLRLHRIGSLLESSLEEAAKNSLSYSDFLDQLLTEEVASKTEKNVAHAHLHGPLPLRQDPGELRLCLPALHR